MVYGDLDGEEAATTVGLESLLRDALRAVPARAATFYTPDLPVGDDGGFWMQHGVPPGFLGEYMEHHRELDPWAEAASRLPRYPAGTVLDTDLLVPAGDLARTEFHDRYLRPHGVARCLVGVVDTGRTPAMPRIRLTVMRGAEEPGFTPEEVGRFAVLTRAARPLVALSRAREAVEHVMSVQQATLDLVRIPVILADAGRRIVAVNRSATESLRADGPLELRDRLLRGRDRRIDFELGEALRLVAAAPGDVRVVRLGRGRRGPREAAVVVTAVPGGAGGGAPVLAVRVLEPDPPGPDGARILGLLLDLTRAEVAVAVGLGEGLSHEDIARRRGVKVTTVRTTLRRLQEKLGIRRSAELARFIQGLTAVGGLRL